MIPAIAQGLPVAVATIALLVKGCERVNIFAVDHWRYGGLFQQRAIVKTTCHQAISPVYMSVYIGYWAMYILGIAKAAVFCIYWLHADEDGPITITAERYANLVAASAEP